VMLRTLKPALFNARTADSRPGPGPLTMTSRFLTPYSCAAVPAFSAATCAANGVLLREPRKPEPPEVAHDSVLPCRSVIVMIVLLNDAWMCATPSSTCFLTFFRVFVAGFAMSYFLIGRRGPLRVRALVRVRWPRDGRPRRWRRTR